MDQGCDQAIRPHRSFSQWSEYGECGWRYRIHRNLQIPEVPAVWSAGGQTFHGVSESFDRVYGNVLEDVVAPATIREWREIWLHRFDDELDNLRQIAPEDQWRTAGKTTKEWPEGENVEWWKSHGPDMIERYIRWRHSMKDRLWIVEVEHELAIEWPVTTPMGEDQVPVLGYVDRLFEDVRTWQCIVVDLKTGASKPATPAQLGQYSVQLEEQIGRPIRWGGFYDARSGTMEPIDLTAWTSETLGVAYDNLDRAVKAGIFVPNLGRHCFKCPVREFCVFQGGSEPPVDVNGDAAL